MLKITIAASHTETDEKNIREAMQLSNKLNVIVELWFTHKFNLPIVIEITPNAEIKTVISDFENKCAERQKYFDSLIPEYE